jgi:hypothetical protein
MVQASTAARRSSGKRCSKLDTLRASPRPVAWPPLERAVQVHHPQHPRLVPHRSERLHRKMTSTYAEQTHDAHMRTARMSMCVELPPRLIFSCVIHIHCVCPLRPVPSRHDDDDDSPTLHDTFQHTLHSHSCVVVFAHTHTARTAHSAHQKTPLCVVRVRMQSVLECIAVMCVCVQRVHSSRCMQVCVCVC